MLERVKGTFDLNPERLIADTAYGTGRMPGWPACCKIAQHIPVVDEFNLRDRFRDVAELVDAAKHEVLAYIALHESLRSKLQSANPPNA